jgi:histidinol phosphatase-like enzyme
MKLHLGCGNKHIEGANDVELINELIEPVLWQYKIRGWVIFGITNQGGVAHGYKTLADVLEESIVTQGSFKRNPIDFIFYSAHDPKGKIVPFNTRSLLRMPYYGMAVQAEVKCREEGGIILNWNDSILVGAKEEDKQMAKAIDVKYWHPDKFFTITHLEEMRSTFIPPKPNVK